MAEQKARYRPTGYVPRPAGAPMVPGARRPRRIGGRHTRFVAMMKLVLPVIAAILIALVVAWPQLQDKKEGFRLGLSNITVHEKGGQQVVNARFTGNDRDKRPFTVTADSAFQTEDKGDTFALEFPKADIAMSDGSWMALTAESGTYDKREQTLNLSGGVNLFHDEGYEFHTPTALINLRDGSAYGEQPVAGQGPLGTLQAAGFRVLDRGKRLIFSGKAKLVLHPARQRGSK